MRLKFLGTGNAAGIPLYGCECGYCKKVTKDLSLQRTPCSALLTIGDKRYLIDAGQTDLHKKFKPHSIDGIFLTHFHPDHVQGLFHLRWGINLQIPVYTPPDSQGCADLYKHSGILEFIPQKKFKPFNLEQLTITPLPLIHSKVTFGYLFEYQSKKLAYLTDTKGLPDNTIEFLKNVNLDLMILDCTFKPDTEARNHNNFDDAIMIENIIQPKKIILTHIGHDFDVWLQTNHNKLPKNMTIAKDNQELLII